MMSVAAFARVVSYLCGGEARSSPTPNEQTTQIKLRVINRKTQQPIPFIVFVIGAPGVGKGTQCSFLVERFGFKHLSYGDLMRQLKQSQDAVVSKLDTKEGTKNPSVPSDVSAWLLWRKICHETVEDGMRWLVDGFPRRKDQVDEWLKLLPPAALALYLRCPIEVSLRRVEGRGREAGDGARPEDLDSRIAVKRIQEFYKNSAQVLDTLKQVGIPVVEVDTDQASVDIEAYLDEVVTAHMGTYLI